MGFRLGVQRDIHHARVGGPPIRINNHGVNALQDNDNDCDMDQWIFPTLNGGLTSWNAKDFVPITFIQE